MDHEQIKPNGANVLIEGPGGDTVLMVLGSYGKWMLPGGGVERGELSVHAAMEEALEETGLILDRKDLELIALLVQKVVHNQKPVPMSGIISLYRCSKYEGELFTKPTPEVVEWRFMTLTEVLALYDEEKAGRPYVKMLIIHDNIKRGLLKPVYEAVLADQFPYNSSRFI